jgi:hypothetical protein
LALHPQGGEFSDRLFLALAEHGLGHADAAREAAVKARATKPGAKAGPVRTAAELELLDATLPLPRM